MCHHSTKTWLARCFADCKPLAPAALFVVLRCHAVSVRRTRCLLFTSASTSCRSSQLTTQTKSVTIRRRSYSASQIWSPRINQCQIQEQAFSVLEKHFYFLKMTSLYFCAVLYWINMEKKWYGLDTLSVSLPFCDSGKIQKDGRKESCKPILKVEYKTSRNRCDSIVKFSNWVLHFLYLHSVLISKQSGDWPRCYFLPWKSGREHWSLNPTSFYIFRILASRNDLMVRNKLNSLLNYFYTILTKRKMTNLICMHLFTDSIIFYTLFHLVRHL